MRMSDCSSECCSSELEDRRISRAGGKGQVAAIDGDRLRLRYEQGVRNERCLARLGRSEESADQGDRGHRARYPGDTRRDRRQCSGEVNGGARRLRSCRRAPRYCAGRGGELSMSKLRYQIGRAHVCTPVTNAHLVCRLLRAKKKLRTPSTILFHLFRRQTT